MKNLILFGAGGLGREMAYLVERINRQNPTYNLLGFAVGKEYYQPNVIVNGYPILGTDDWVVQHRDHVVCSCTIALPTVRQTLQETLEEKGVVFETLISPDVDVHSTNCIGTGAILCRGVSVTTNITIGKGVFINGQTSIGHDVVIDDYTCVFSRCGIASYTRIGKRVRVGGFVYFVPKVKIGDEAVIAAGSIVFTNVKANTHVLGNPARRIEL